MKKINTIAKQLLKKNPGLVARIERAYESKTQYKATAESVTSRLCASIGKREGQFVKQNELVWAVINEVNGETQEDELDY